MYKYSEFIYSEKVENEISTLLKNHRDNFKPKLLNKNCTTDNAKLFGLFPIMEELKHYYNNELCVSIATCIAVERNIEFDLKTHSYYAESAIIRIANIWEYLFIVLNQFLGIQMIVGRDLRQSIIEAKCHNIEFIKHEGGYKPKITRLPEDVIEKIKPLLKKEQKLFDISVKAQNNSFHKQVKKKYSRNENLQFIFDLYYCDVVKEIISIRNEIVHRRPLSAKGSVAPIDFLPTQGISYDPKGWFDFKDLGIKLEKNIYALKAAIQMLIDLIFSNDIPNLKENEDNTFFVYKVSCKCCNKVLLINDFTVKNFQENNMNIICPYCEKDDTVTGDIMEVHDNYYFENIYEYTEFLIKYWRKDEK